MFRMGNRVNEKVINVHNYIGKAVYDGYHQVLEAGRTAQQPPWAGNPLKLTHAQQSECSVWVGPGEQDHLPESCSEINGKEDCAT